MSQTKRIKSLRVSGATILRIFINESGNPEAKPGDSLYFEKLRFKDAPSDLSFERAFYDLARSMFVLIVSSGSFEEVPEGALCGSIHYEHEFVLTDYQGNVLQTRVEEPEVREIKFREWL